MKINKWTLALAAAGVVSLPAGIQAEEKPNQVLTALSNTTLSGYVDTSAHWNPGTGNANPAPYAFNAGKQDGFNLDSVVLQLQKPISEGDWGAGYTAILMFGPDAAGTTGSSGEYVREAHVDLHTPLGNGLIFKLAALATSLAGKPPRLISTRTTHTLTPGQSNPPNTPAFWQPINSVAR